MDRPAGCVWAWSMAGLIVHLATGGLEQRLAELCDVLSGLLERLQREGVQSAVLFQPQAVGEAAAALRQLRVQDGTPGFGFLVCQPLQLSVTLRLAAARLAMPPARLAVLSIAATGSLADQAAAMGCCAVHLLPGQALGQLHASALRAVATAAAAADPGTLVVGYAMKPSREAELSSRGMLPLLPQDGICFVPLSLEGGPPLDVQLAGCHAVLQKCTDYLQHAPGSGAPPSFAPQALALAAALEQRPQLLLVDPLPALGPITDRVLLAEVLVAATEAVRRQGIPMRSPAWALLAPGQQLGADISRQVAAAGVQLPCIVKPQAACGVPEAHQMAFVLAPEGFPKLQVPLPAVVQEYVDHGGRVWKVYVAGEQVFWTERKSTPDLGPLARQWAQGSNASGPTCISFDSLASLPTHLPVKSPAAAAEMGASPPAAAAAAAAAAATTSTELQPAAAVPALLRPEVLHQMAAALRGQLHLTLFGFDVVYDASAGELVIIDVNYFPSFNGIPEAPAALRAALLDRYHRAQPYVPPRHA